MSKNFALTAVSVASRLLVSTLLFLLLARLWGPAQFGTFTFVFSLTALLTLSVDFGMPMFLLREIGADPANASALIARSIKAKFVLTALMILVAAVLAIALAPHTLPLALFITLSVAAILQSYAEYFIAPLRAFGRYDLEAYLAAVGNAVQFLLAGVTAWAGGSPTAVAVGIMVSRLAYASASWAVLSRLVRIPRAADDGTSVWATLRELWPYGIDGALTSIWGFLDVVVVRILFGAHIVGLYSAGQKCVQGVVALAPVVGNVMIPRLARQATLRAPDTWRLASYAGCLMIAVGATFALPLIAAPRWVVDVAFGPEFAELEHWLPWFGAILLARFTGAAFGVVLSAIGLPKKRVVGQVAALLIYLGVIALIKLNDLSPVAVLYAMLAAMTTMGSVYAAYLIAARKSDFLGISATAALEGPLTQRRVTARDKKEE